MRRPIKEDQLKFNIIDENLPTQDVMFSKLQNDIEYMKNIQMCAISDSCASVLFNNYMSLNFSRSHINDMLTITPLFELPSGKQYKYKFDLQNSFSFIDSLDLNTLLEVSISAGHVGIHELLDYTHDLIKYTISHCSMLHANYHNETGSIYNNPVYDIIEGMLVDMNDEEGRVEKRRLNLLHIDYYDNTFMYNNKLSIYPTIINIRMDSLYNDVICKDELEDEMDHPHLTKPFIVEDDLIKSRNIQLRIKYPLDEIQNENFVKFTNQIIKETIWFYYTDPFNVFEKAWDLQVKMQGESKQLNFKKG